MLSIREESQKVMMDANPNDGKGISCFQIVDVYFACP